MKTIGIIGAMDSEIDFLKSKVEIVSAKNIVGANYFMGKMHGKNVVIVRSGIGKVNASICAQILIDMYAVDYIINTGVAGAINKELELGDVVISKDLMYHDFDVTSLGYSIGTIPEMDESVFSADQSLIDLAERICDEKLPNKKSLVGRIVSGDVFVGSKAQKDKIWNDVKGNCAEMEGAAIAHTCYLNKIPFLVIRAISDKADDAAKETYSNGLDIAVESSSIVTYNLIKEI